MIIDDIEFWGSTLNRAFYPMYHEVGTGIKDTLSNALIDAELRSWAWMDDV